MKNKNLVTAYDSIPIDPDMAKRIWERMEQEKGTKAGPRLHRNRRRTVRVLLVAAVLSVLMGITAYAAGVSIHARRQEQLREGLRIEENRVEDYVENAVPVQSPSSEETKPHATLLSVLADNDGFRRVYVDVSPVPPEEVRDGFITDTLDDGDWDLYSIEYSSSLDDSGWQEAFIYTGDWDYTEDELVTVTDPDYGTSWRLPTDEAMLQRFLTKGYDPETQTLTLECTYNVSDAPEGESARLHIISISYRAKIDASGRETKNDAEILRDFGCVEVPPVDSAVRTVLFTEPRPLTADGEFGPITGEFIGAELNATGVVWLYRIQGTYSASELLELTDEYEADAVLELRGGETKPISVSVRTETGPLLRDYCGFAGTVDINEVVGITAGGVHYDLKED